MISNFITNEGGVGDAAGKVAAQEEAGVRVARTPEEIPGLVRGR